MSSVMIAGREVDASKLVCPECRALWLETTVDTVSDTVVWTATCPHGHSWEFCW